MKRGEKMNKIRRDGSQFFLLTALCCLIAAISFMKQFIEDLKN
jgi:hypothetical protein